MKLMTWNIWGGKHVDHVIELIKEENPDILALQEVKTLDGSNHGEKIARELGFSLHYCKSFTTDRHTPVFDLGNALLSKAPIKNHSCHFLSTLEQYKGSSASEPRTAAEITIEHNNQDLTVFTTHLGYSDGFSESKLRDYQLENLVRLIKGKKCVLMGDFNSLPDSRVVKELEEILVNTDQEKKEISYTDQKHPDHPQYRIDYILVEKSISFKNFGTRETSASDHLPLVVEIE